MIDSQIMGCAECKLLAGQAAIALEEVQRIKEQIPEALGNEALTQELLRELEARERIHDRSLAALERHQASHQRGVEMTTLALWA